MLSLTGTLLLRCTLLTSRAIRHQQAAQNAICIRRTEIHALTVQAPDVATK